MACNTRLLEDKELKFLRTEVKMKTGVVHILWNKVLRKNIKIENNVCNMTADAIKELINTA